MQRSFQQLDEGFLERILLRSAQYSVFQDVGNAGRIGWRRAEGDAENLVFVVIFQREHFCAGLGVPIEPCTRLQFVDLLITHQFEAIS